MEVYSPNGDTTQIIHNHKKSISYRKAMGWSCRFPMRKEPPKSSQTIPGVTRPAMRRAYWNDLMFTSPLCSLMTSFAGERTPDSAHCSQVIGLSKWMVIDIDRSMDFSIISGKIQKLIPDQGILGNADITPHNRWYRCLFPMVGWLIEWGHQHFPQ